MIRRSRQKQASLYRGPNVKHDPDADRAHLPGTCQPDARRRTVAFKPAELTFEEVASLSFGGVTALTFLRDKAGVVRGYRVLVAGVSGAVGTAAVQIATHFGTEVTAVTSTSNATLAASIGADKVSPRHGDQPLQEAHAIGLFAAFGWRSRRRRLAVPGAHALRSGRVSPGALPRRRPPTRHRRDPPIARRLR